MCLFRLRHHPYTRRLVVRTVVALVAVLLLGTLFASPARAALRKQASQPRRIVVVPMAEQVRIERHGQPALKTTYTGERDGFRAPALFYYGYPWNERTYGTGLNP